MRHLSPYIVSKTVSRVLYLTVIYLGGLLPNRSSHLLENNRAGFLNRADGPVEGPRTICSPTVLLRIEFTASDSLQPMGELLPRLSILTDRGQPEAGRNLRFISVALFLKSPSAGVTRYPCPMEPGLSS